MSKGMIVSNVVIGLIPSLNIEYHTDIRIIHIGFRIFKYYFYIEIDLDKYPF